MFRSVTEAVLTMRKLLAWNFCAWFLGSECDGLASAFDCLDTASLSRSKKMFSAFS